MPRLAILAQMFGLSSNVIAAIEGVKNHICLDAGIAVEDLPLIEGEMKAEFNKLLFSIRRRFKEFFDSLTQLIKELQRKEKIGDKQIQQSKQHWEVLIQKSREFFDTDAEISEFHVMQKFLSYMISDVELLIVFYELAKNQNHPHAVAIEDSKGVEKASLII